jgi:hypothetical protein
VVENLFVGENPSMAGFPKREAEILTLRQEQVIGPKNEK